MASTSAIVRDLMVRATALATLPAAAAFGPLGVVPVILSMVVGAFGSPRTRG